MEDVTDNLTAQSTLKQNFPAVNLQKNGKGQIWISCSDLECFKKQGGVFDPNAKQVSRTKSISTRLEQVKAVREQVWEAAAIDATKIVPEHTDDPTLDPKVNKYNKQERDKTYRITFLSLISTYTDGFSA